MTDTGTGMTPEVKAHLFEPFYTTKEPGKGTGLGLSTVYGIVVNQSSGSIWVYSEPGQGTTFKLFFPSVAVEAASGPAPVVEGVTAHGETILLAEDEAGVRKYTRQILERYGYTTLEATNGVEALTVAHNHSGPVHLLLTDIIMPVMGGVELSEKFSAEFPGVPVLFMTGYTDQIIRHYNALSAYIQKPFTLSDLLTQVRDLLDRTTTNASPAEGNTAAG
jgi:CheY-like chemotaxis protein